MKREKGKMPSEWNRFTLHTPRFTLHASHSSLHVSSNFVKR